MDGHANLGVVAPGCDWVRVPRGGDPSDGPGAVLHAKAVVHDNEQVFVTSANLTPKALDRNIEAGVLVRDRSLAQALASHGQRLIDTSLVVPLPPVPSVLSRTTLSIGKRGGRWG
ncbi:MAG: phospholipase D-like domain-containing protein [Chloroflexi bacterium]|nr:phospholipase D-like domain-containing protein [Chloroflexota bacterium]